MREREWGTFERGRERKSVRRKKTDRKRKRN